jgi:hypothetical protein
MGVLFLCTMLPLVLPSPAVLSWCHGMEQVMLEDCCGGATFRITDVGPSLHGPDCCDSIATPELERQVVSSVVLPALALTGLATVILPPMMWSMGPILPLIPPTARGPPPKNTPRFILFQALLR